MGVRARFGRGLEATLGRNELAGAGRPNAGGASSWRTTWPCRPPGPRSSPVRQVRGAAVHPDVRMSLRISRALATTRPDWLECELRAC